MLKRTLAANQVWSMYLVFDRTAEWRVIKNLTVVDDATHEAVAVVPEQSMGGQQLVRILDHLLTARGLPKASSKLDSVNTTRNDQKSLGGLTPAAYAKTLIQKSVKLTSDSKAYCY